MISRLSLILAGLAGVGLAAGCTPAPEEPAPEPNTARAVLQSAPGENIDGEVLFEQTDEGVRVRATVSGLSRGEHGFHIHEHGVCERPDFTSAGGHFAPRGNPHGPPGPHSHAGDLGNIEAAAESVAQKVMVSEYITLDENPRSAIGRAVVIHRDRDDLVTQPAGNAGPRVACGVIQRLDER